MNGAIPDVVLALTALKDLQESTATRHRAQRQDAGRERKASASELGALEKQITNLVGAIASGLISDSVTDALKTAEAKKKELSEKLVAPEPKQDNAVPNVNLSIVRTAAEAIAAMLPDMSVDAPVVMQYRQLVDHLIEKIAVHPEGRRGTALEVHGRLASLLATIKAWEDEEKRLRSMWLQKF